MTHILNNILPENRTEVLSLQKRRHWREISNFKKFGNCKITKSRNYKQGELKIVEVKLEFLIKKFHCSHKFYEFHNFKTSVLSKICKYLNYKILSSEISAPVCIIIFIPRLLHRPQRHSTCRKCPS